MCNPCIRSARSLPFIEDSVSTLNYLKFVSTGLPLLLAFIYVFSYLFVRV